MRNAAWAKVGAALAGGLLAVGGATGAAAQVPGPAPTAAASSVELTSDAVFGLSSLPGSDRTIYLDFDGHEVVDTTWGEGVVAAAPFDLDGESATFSADELAAIFTIWSAVSEDFAPFDVNVTTAEPAPGAIDRENAADTTYGTRVAIGDRSPAMEGSTVGLAATGVFDYYPASTSSQTHADLQPAWVDAAPGAPAELIAAIVSHEVGHTLGLGHVSVPTTPTAWQPLMAESFSAVELTQWSDLFKYDTYLDPFALFAEHGLSVRADDHGDGAADGTLLASSALVDEGLIATRDDIDVFSVTVDEGLLEFTVAPVEIEPNLLVSAELVDADGAAVATSPAASDPTSGPAARLSATVPAGTYHLRVDGVGYDGPEGTWNDYGSVGRYTVEGLFTAAPEITSIGAETAAVAEGGTVTVSGTVTSGDGATGTATWGDGVETPVTVDGGTFETERTFDDDNPAGTASDDVTVEVSVTTAAGSGTAQTSVTVLNVPPALGPITLSSERVPPEGKVTVTTLATDPAIGASSETFTASAVWSDGVVTPVTLTRRADALHLSTERTFGASDIPAGELSTILTVLLRIEDDDTGDDDAEAAVTVTADADADGVADAVDLCADTVLPDEPTVSLGKNRYRATVDGFSSGAGDSGPSLADTGGCSGAQIIDAQSLGTGHQRFGISASALEQWIEDVAGM